MNCLICGRKIHTEHNEGDLIKCLRKATEQDLAINEYRWLEQIKGLESLKN